MKYTSAGALSVPPIRGVVLLRLVVATNGSLPIQRSALRSIRRRVMRGQSSPRQSARSPAAPYSPRMRHPCTPACPCYHQRLLCSATRGATHQLWLSGVRWLPQNALEQCGHSPTILSAAEGHCVGLAVISGLASVEGVEPDSSGLGMEGMLYTIRYWHRFLGALELALTMGVMDGSDAWMQIGAGSGDENRQKKGTGGW